MKIIDLSGLGHSGKTAVTDLLREIDGIHAHHNLFEFNLLRLPDGILDMHHALCGNWSPSRSDFAIKRFRRLCEALNENYSEILNSRFMEYSDDYLQSLVLDSLYIDGWFDSLYENNSQKDRIKAILKKFGVFNLSKSLYNFIKPNIRSGNQKTEVLLSDGDNFIENTKTYLEKILFSDQNKNVNTVVTNNGFEPFNPVLSMNYFKDAYSIIVDRDPRDIYTSIVKSEITFIPEFETDEGLFSKAYMDQLKGDMLGIEDIQSFITRQRLYREKMLFEKDHTRIIYVWYEDLVLNYEDTVQEILLKVDVDSHLHIKKKQYFDPAQSKKNVGIWKRMQDSKEIKLIEKELKDYLYTT
jgi:hypothetical protein